jgi:hypothetical protein
VSALEFEVHPNTAEIVARKNLMETSRQEKTMRYLLGKLSEQEKAEFEAQCFDDDDFFQETVELENDLLHSYLRGELSQAERQEFEKGYLITPARRQKVEFAQALEQRLYGTEGVRASSEQEPPLARSKTSVVPAMQNWRVHFLVSAVALAAAAVILWMGIINYQLGRELRQLRSEQAELQRAAHDLEAKLADLAAQRQEGNSDGQLPTHPQFDIMAFNLTPGLPRSPGAVKQLVVPHEVLQIEMRLYLEDDKFTTYRASLQTAEGKQMLQTSGLKSSKDSRGRLLVSFVVPSNALSKGEYLIKLDGKANTGPIEENITAYQFLVVSR